MKRAGIVCGAYLAASVVDWALALTLHDKGFLGHRVDNLVAAAIFAWMWEGRK